MTVLGLMLIGSLALQAPGSARQQPAPAQAPASDRSAQIVADLGNRDWHKRFRAGQAAMGMPASNRSAALIEAIRREVLRLQHLGIGSEEVPPDVSDPEAAWTHYCNLVDVLCEAKDTAVIPALITAVGMGNPVIGALARFGESAVMPLVTGLRASADPAQVQCGMYALHLMIESKTPLSADPRSAVVAFTQERLIGRQYPPVIGRAIQLAGLLGDESLMARLRAIAAAPSETAAGLDLIWKDRFAEVRASAAAIVAKR